MVTAILIVVAVILVVALTAVASAIRVLREYERGIVFRLGRLMEVRGPGLQVLIPSLDRMVRVSLRTVTLSIPPQEIITRDNVPARVTAVTYYRVIDPSKAVTEVESFSSATLQIAQTSLRSVLGVVDLDTLLSEREHLNASLQEVIDAQTEPWGIKVTTVEIKDVEIPERMQHAIARQAEAERERRAKIINAEGEAQAAAKLAEAADVIGRNPVTLQLRYLQTLREIGGTQNSTIVFPIDVVRPMVQALGGAAAASGRHVGRGCSAVGHRATRRDGGRLARGGAPGPAGPGGRGRRWRAGRRGGAGARRRRRRARSAEPAARRRPTTPAGGAVRRVGTGPSTPPGRPSPRPLRSRAAWWGEMRRDAPNVASTTGRPGRRH